MNRFLFYFLITISASLFFIPFLGNVHLFDWDEINFAECAREMLVSGNYSVVQINFEPFWEKPPLFIWMQALSMNIFGINEFAARLPNAICGILTLLVLFHIGKKIFDVRFGLLWAFAYLGSLLPHLYFKSAIIDPWFNLFIFLGIYYFILFLNNPFYIEITPIPKKTNTDYTDKMQQSNRCNLSKIGVILVHNKPLIFSSLFTGMAILTKGPVAFLIFVLCVGVFWLSKRFHPIVSIKNILVFLLILFFTGGSWFLYLIITRNSSIVLNSILYQIRLLTTSDSGHSGFFLYHFWILLLGVFPASVFALPNIFPKINLFAQKNDDAPFQIFFTKWMRILFWVVLLLFSLVKTKIIHYSSLCYFPLTFFAAYTISQHLNNPSVDGWKKWFRIMFAFIGILLGLLFILAPLIEQYKQELIESGIIKDIFAVENLKAPVHWSGWEWCPGMLWLLLMSFWLIILTKYSSKFGLFISSLTVSAVIINILIFAVVPKVEQYTQNAVIEFLQNVKNENAVVETIGYKSYAQYFYAKQTESTNHIFPEKEYYFVSKVTDEDAVKIRCVTCKELYRKNGFIFWKRFP